MEHLLPIPTGLVHGMQQQSWWMFLAAQNSEPLSYDEEILCQTGLQWKQSPPYKPSKSDNLPASPDAKAKENDQSNAHFLD